LSGLVTIWSLALNAVGFLNFQWQWVAVASTIICGFFIWWVLYGLHRRIQQLEDTRPSLKVWPIKDRLEGAQIEVINNGAEGEFEAQIEASDYSGMYIPPQWRRYHGYWEGEQGSIVTIMRGMKRRLKLATFEMSPFIASARLDLYQITSQGMVSWPTHSYSILQPKSSVIPQIYLKVTISSIPSPRHGPVNLSIKVNAKDGIEIL